MKAGFLQVAAVSMLIAVFPIRGAVELDLTGLSVGSGNRLSIAADGVLGRSQLYDITISATGAGTGTLGDLIGSGDLKARLAPYASDVPDPFHITLLNKNGRLPVIVKSVGGSATFTGLPLNGSTVDLRATATLTFRAMKSGSVLLKAGGINLKGIDSGTKRVLDGDWTVTSGSISVKEGVASSDIPKVDMMAQYYASQVLGNDFYTTIQYQTYVGVELRRGQVRSRLVILQNDGPANDSFRIRAEINSTGVDVKVFDGKTNVTELVRQGTFEVTDLPPGGLKILKVVFSKPRSVAETSSVQVHVTGLRSAAPGTRDVVSFVTFTP